MTQNVSQVTGAQNISQGHRVKVPAESVLTSRRSTMQGLVVVRLIVEKIWNFNVNCVKATGAQNMVKVTGSMYLPSQEVREMCHARYDGCCRIVVDWNTNFDINVELQHKF